MEKQIIYCEATYANTLDWFPVRDTQDYKNKLAQLRANYSNVQVVFREWSDGTVEDGELED